MKNLVLAIFLAFVLLSLVCGTCLYLIIKPLDTPHTCPLPSLSQVQERIGAVPDGVWGEETKRLWDKAINDIEFNKIWEREVK